MDSLLIALILIAPVAGLTWWAGRNANKELKGR